MYTLNELIDKAYKELLNSGLSERTVYGGNWYVWNRLVRKYGGDEIFYENMCYEYCKEYFQRDIFAMSRNDLLQVEKRYISAFNNLIQSSKNIPFKEFDAHYHRDFKLDDKSQSVLDAYIEKCREDGNSDYTIKNKKLRIRNFMIDIDFINISKDAVITYLKMRRTKQGLIAYTIDTRLLRRFLVFCYEKGVISKEVLFSWPEKMPDIQNKEIPSVYTPDEISILLESARSFTHEDNHLRNYAILSLIAYTGMRANDVVHLRPGDIDWRNNEIRIIQQKTKREVVFPLLPQVGNPIIEYIQKERPNGKWLFLTEKGGKLCTASISRIINIYFEQSPVKINGRHFGAHSLRHSIATNMVNDGISLFSVANVLGHSGIDCVKMYGKVDITNLRKCVLEAPYHA